LSEDALASYVAGQLNHLFNDGRAVSGDSIRELLPMSLQRLEHCFSRINDKYFFNGQSVLFNHLHGDQFAMFLYLLANTAHNAGAGDDLPSKLFLLNKALHGIDAFYEVELPSVFLFVHPLATVLGRGTYSDYLMVYQRCGVGSNHDVYPTLGEFVTLRPGASVLGNSRIGRNCTIAAESLVLDRDVADDSIYIGNPRDFATRREAVTPKVWRI
jgi:serine O-acetyltransferase